MVDYHSTGAGSAIEARDSAALGFQAEEHSILKRKIRVGVLCGGRSAEHEVSVTSARSMLEALDRDKYELVMVGISKQGQWFTAADAQQLLAAGAVESDGLTPVTIEVFNVLGQKMRTLVSADLMPGYHKVSWDGRNDGGLEVASGIYIYRLCAGDYQQSRRLLLVR